MGCLSLFCCFKSMRPNVITLIAIISNLIAVAFLIWGLADLLWYRKGRKALYIISFVLLCLTLILLVIIIVFLNLRIGPNFMTIYKVGKILILIDYNDIEDFLGPGRSIPSHDWAAAILPGILGLIASVIVSLCANVLYKIFNDNILTSFDIYQNNNPMNINQNSMTTIPNVQNPVVVVSGNNSGMIPPTNPYNQPKPVFNSESGINYNNK